MMLEWIGLSSISNPDDPAFPRDVWIKASDVTKVFVEHIPLPFTAEGYVNLAPEHQVSYVKITRLYDEEYVASGPWPHQKAREIAAQLVELLGGSLWIGVQ